MSNMPDLSTLAMIGEVGKGIFEDMGIDIRAAFNKAMEENKDLPAHERLNKAMTAQQEEILTKAPVWMRINMLSHKISSAREKGVPESEVDWKKINHYLTVNTDKSDFNNFDEINSYDDFYEASNTMIMAQVDLAPWRKEKCKECGEYFYMMQGELWFFTKKDLNLPKRCRRCRDKRKGIVHPEPKKVNKTPAKSQDEHTPTAMEIAMKNAGVIK